MTLNNWIISWMFQTKSTCGMAQGKNQTVSPCADGLNCWNCTIPFGKRSGCMNWFLWARNLADWCGILSLLARDLAAGALQISNPFGKDFDTIGFADFKSFWQGFSCSGPPQWGRCSLQSSASPRPCLPTHASLCQLWWATLSGLLTRPPCKCQHCHQIDDLCCFCAARQPFLLPQFWL